MKKPSIGFNIHNGFHLSSLHQHLCQSLSTGVTKTQDKYEEKGYFGSQFRGSQSQQGRTISLRALVGVLHDDGSQHMVEQIAFSWLRTKRKKRLGPQNLFRGYNFHDLKTYEALPLKVSVASQEHQVGEQVFYHISLWGPCWVQISQHSVVCYMFSSPPRDSVPRIQL